MSIAYRVQDYIAENGAFWDPVPHRKSATCREAARIAHVPAEQVAKAVVLKDTLGYVVAVIPASAHLDVLRLDEALGRSLELASESELARLFPDCVLGAVPPLGAAYGVPTLWATGLAERADVYFEGGDQRTLVHMPGVTFGELMRRSRALPARSYH
jgi:Ala-tRNA(Pro) deacylase